MRKKSRFIQSYMPWSLYYIEMQKLFEYPDVHTLSMLFGAANYYQRGYYGGQKIS